MKLYLAHFALVLAVLITAQSALAGVLLEPSLSYEDGIFRFVALDSYTAVSGISSYGGRLAATGGGIKLGYQFPNLIYANFSYFYSGGTLKPVTSESSTNKAVRNNFGIELGYEVPKFRFRGWMGFCTSCKLTIIDYSSGNLSVIGTASSLGGGVRIVRDLYINLNYILYSYQRIIGPEHSFTPDDKVSSYFSNTFGQSFIVSISYPLEFGRRKRTRR